MEKVVVLSCTNRPNSNTLKVSRIYENILLSKHVEAKLLDFCDLPDTLAFTETFGKRSSDFALLINEYISSSRKFIFVVPEYNGSFPGILKTFLDSISPREWADKDACLVGVADGRAGNLRVMEHLTGIHNYLKMHVYHNKLPISVINRLIAVDGSFNDLQQQQASLEQVEGFLKF
jgi:NAD(P)H-dependent FMN reductase